MCVGRCNMPVVGGTASETKEVGVVIEVEEQVVPIVM